jgi:hypothetical protein
MAAALLVAAAAALTSAFRIGAACSAGGEDLLAELRAGTERRVAGERVQIRPALDAAARGELAAARREAEAVLTQLDGNSQLHLLLAVVYRNEGRPGPALREYRRAVELVRDYSDRRSPQFIGAALDPWLRQLRPSLSGEALGNRNYLSRAMAGGCS